MSLALYKVVCLCLGWEGEFRAVATRWPADLFPSPPPGIGVPIMLAYVYGVVPISLCRGGGCGVSTANGKGVKIEFDEDDGPITGKERIFISLKFMGQKIKISRIQHILQRDCHWIILDNELCRG